MARPMSTYQVQAYHSNGLSPRPPSRARTQMSGWNNGSVTERPQYIPLRSMSPSRGLAVGVQTEPVQRIPSPTFHGGYNQGLDFDTSYDEGNYYQQTLDDLYEQYAPRTWNSNQLRPKTPNSTKGPPILRQGRVGSCWRHIKQCTGNLGNHIMFVDGTVKESDCIRYPPHGYPGLTFYKAQPWSYARKAPLSVSRRPAASANNPYSDHARKGFKYWYDEKRPLKLAPTSIQGRIMKSGAAY